MMAVPEQKGKPLNKNAPGHPFAHIAAYAESTLLTVGASDLGARKDLQTPY